MARLTYFTEAKIDQLRVEIEDRLEWYYSPKKQRLGTMEGHEFRVSKIEVSIPTLDMADDQPHRTDLVNSLRVYEAMRSLTRHQASDERLWAYLCHFHLAEYVTYRWLERRPESDKKAITKVYNHFFARGSRRIIRDNGVSRLWWLGFMANRVDSGEPEKFLEIVLHRQDVRSSVLERPFLARNLRALAMIYQVMREHWEIDKKRVLFRRVLFRRWMRALNRRGGVILFDALSERRMLSILRYEAEKVLSVQPATRSQN